jgi:hypothetical protein
MLKRLITPTTRSQLEWIGQTYGIAPAINEWCREIVNAADRPERPITEVLLMEVLDEIESLANLPRSDWSLSLIRFLEAGWLDRIRAIRAMIVYRSLPNRMRVNTKVFPGLSDGRIQIEIKAVYEIDLGQRTVTFYSLWSYSPDQTDCANNDDEARPW